MRIVGVWAGLVFGLDQISKIVVLRYLRLDEIGSFDLAPPFLVLRMAWNRGVNFGLMSTGGEAGRWLLIALALAICLWVLSFVRREAGLGAQVSAGLLLGGALGNVADRLIYGAVADFLNMSCCGNENPYSFNIADIAIFAGAVGLILLTGKGAKPA